MPANSLRGTVTSSKIVVGRSRASALKALRRAVASNTASAADAARFTSIAPCARHSSSTFNASSITAAGCPSVSIKRIASASRGRPTFVKSSTHWIVLRSRNSSVHGIIFAAMIADTVSAAASMRA